MKLIFLDIDGCLNHKEGKERIPHPWNPDRRIRGIEADCVAALNKILENHPDALLISSTTWTKYFSLDQIYGFLKEKGYNGPKFTDKTDPDFHAGNRVWEIRGFIDSGGKTDILDIIVIDDQNMENWYEILSERENINSVELIQCNSYGGGLAGKV